MLSGEAASLAEDHVGGGAAFQMSVGGAESIALAKPLRTFSSSDRAILLLAYPKAEALADARKLQLALGVMTLLGLLLVAIATWKAAGRITQPLARLDEAAGRLAAGDLGGKLGGELAGGAAGLSGERVGVTGIDHQHARRAAFELLAAPFDRRRRAFRAREHPSRRRAGVEQHQQYVGAPGIADAGGGGRQPHARDRGHVGHRLRCEWRDGSGHRRQALNFQLVTRPLFPLRCAEREPA